MARAAGKGRRTRAGAKTATDYANLKADVKKLGKTSKQLVRACIVILPMVVILLQTDSSEVIQQFILSRKPFTLYEITIVLWFACWVFGAPFDIDIQEDAFIADEDRGAIGFGVVATVVAFVLIATGFLYLYKIEAAFQLGLLVFVVANALALRVLNKRSRKAIGRSRTIMTADGDSFGLEKLRAVEHYLLGKWQTRRFRAMIAMAVLQLIVACLWRFTSASHILDGVSIRGMSGARLAPFVPAILFALFVAVSESWIMKHRNDTLATIRSLESLSLRYSLKPKPAPAKDETDWGLYPFTD